MSNPWMKKNPFISMWLSAANRVAGSVRGQAAAEAKRQFNAAASAAIDKNTKLWQTAPPSPRATTTPKQKRRS